MDQEIYRRLAKVLDTLPNGFPSTDSGFEIKLLKKVFTQEEGDLFCDLRLTFESAEQIAQRTGRPLEGLDKRLTSMQQKGQIFGIDFGEVKVYKMLPWLFGIYEFQLNRLDREFCEIHEEFMKIYGKQFFSNKPQLMQVVPVEQDISARQEALSYELVSSIIETGQSFGISECICNKEEKLLGRGCDKPQDSCLGIAPVPGIFDNDPWKKSISKQEAYALLARAEEHGLVHLSWNIQGGQLFICNCCGCCCHVLRGITELGISPLTVVNAHYYAHIDPETCAVCGICADERDERCQVKAIGEGEDAYQVIKDKCIGCGLCVSTCPSEAISLIKRDEKDQDPPPQNEEAWFEERGRLRGVDFSKYK